MITIKLPYKTNDDNYSLIMQLMREQSIVMKFSYNRFKEGLKEKEIRSLLSGLNNISNIDTWFIQSSIYEGKAIMLANFDKKANEHNKVIFNKI